MTAPSSEAPDQLEAGRKAIERALAETTERAYALAGARDPLSPEEKAKPGTALKTYRLATQLAAPIAPLVLAWCTQKGKEELNRRPERYDELIRAANREGELRPRLDLLQQAEALLMEDLPILPLYHYTSKYLQHPSVTGREPNLLEYHPWKRVGIE